MDGYWSQHHYTLPAAAQAIECYRFAMDTSVADKQVNDVNGEGPEDPGETISRVMICPY